MLDIDTICDALGVVISTDEQGDLHHLGTAWHLGGGDWLTYWPDESEPPSTCQLIHATTGTCDTVQDWEWANGLAGFRASAAGNALTMANDDGQLQKRMPLFGLGYPCVIEYPAFQLHRGSLDASRYHPYLCPWRLTGHLALFGADDAWLTGRFYQGLAGSPILREDGSVIGMVADGEAAPDHPALTRFIRIGQA